MVQLFCVRKIQKILIFFRYTRFKKADLNLDIILISDALLNFKLSIYSLIKIKIYLINSQNIINNTYFQYCLNGLSITEGIIFFSFKGDR